MGKNIVLFVDDELTILNSIRQAVVDEDYQAMFANSGQQALAIMEQEAVTVLATDMSMPVMDGLTLLKTVIEKYPAIVGMVLSGYTQNSQVMATIDKGDIFKFITKPWKREEELLESVRAAIEYYNFRQEGGNFKKSLKQRSKVNKNGLKIMEEKASTIKTDFDNVKKLDQWIFRFVKNKLVAGDANVATDQQFFLEQIDTVSALHSAYMDILPTNIIEFDLERVKQDLNEFMMQRGTNWKLEVNSSNSVNCVGNYKLLLLVLTTLWNNLTQLGTDKPMYCQVAGGVIDDKVKLNFSIITPSIITQARDRKYADGIEKLHMIVALFNELCALSNIYIVMQDRSEELLVLIQLEYSNHA
ncbi:MAG TPA: response regulator [Negativicutes bacterium]